MKVCPHCGEKRHESEFWWDDGVLRGESKRCATCRAARGGNTCECCLALRAGQTYSRASRPPRCVACRGTEWPGATPRYQPRFLVRPHAVARFHERVRPDLLRYQETLDVMYELMAEAPLSMMPPDWYAPAASPSDVFKRGFLHVADGVIFTLADYRGNGVRVSTVLTRDGFALPESVGPVPRWVVAIHRARIARIAAEGRRRERRAQRENSQ